MKAKKVAVAVATASIAGVVSFSAQAAPFANGDVGIMTWNADVESDTHQVPDTNENQRWDTGSSYNAGFFIDIEDSMGLPGIRAINQRLNYDADYTFEQETDTGDTVYPEGDYEASISVEHFDVEITKSLPIPTPNITTRIGTGARFNTSEFETETPNSVWNKTEDSVRFTFMADSRVSIPSTGLSLYAQYRMSPQSGKSLDQFEGRVEYQFSTTQAFNPGVFVGYRYMEMEDSELDFVDAIKTKGVKGGGFIRF